MCDPKMILLDEPGAGVNRVLMRKLTDDIERLRRELGITFFVIEHDMDLVTQLCDTVIVMSEGSEARRGDARGGEVRRASAGGLSRWPVRKVMEEAGGQEKPVILEARDVVTGYGETNILHGVSVKVRRGEMAAVIGPNGAGKSTLLKAIFGLLPVRSGSVHINGDDVNQRERRTSWCKKGLGYVPQVDNVFPSLTIMENLQMGAFVRKDGVKDRVDAGVGPVPGPRRPHG